MQYSKKDIEKILGSIRYATISTSDTDGLAWAAPVWYVFDDELNIYWWSPTNSQHSKNISSNQNIYITVFDSTLPEGEGLGVYVRATAQEVKQDELDDAMYLYNQSTKVFKMVKENCTEDAPTRMYKASPLEIWMNDGSDDLGFWQDFRTRVSS